MSPESTQIRSNMVRACLYAKDGTVPHNQANLDDQLSEARERAQREKWQIVAEHTDGAVRGSVPVALRDGGKALLADVLAGRFDVLLLEGLNRISRDHVEAETFVKHLEHRGIRIIGTADGYDTRAEDRKVMRIARRLVNELFLDDLRERTHRGLVSQFLRGLHVGGVHYGYRSHPSADGSGRELVIDDAQAAVVRRIFEDFAAGHSANDIVHTLNAEGVARPRSSTWTVSSLLGNSKRRAGVLNNELYTGRMLWNRRQWLKDPETGKRRFVDRPQAEWLVREVSSLRIVPAELWEAVRHRQRTHPPRGTRCGGGTTPSH